MQEELVAPPDSEADFIYGDRINRILGLKRDKENLNLLVKVSWEKRKNGEQPKDCWMLDMDVKLGQPLALFEYYEKRIRFI